MERVIEKTEKVTGETNVGRFNDLFGELREYISKLPELRVFVPAGPGMGHQTNTVNIMMRIIEFGFRANILLIYDNTNDPEGGKGVTIEKLAILIPGLNPDNPQEMKINGAIVTFIALSQWDPTKYEEMPLGITGAADSNPDKNLATMYNVKFFLLLQPFMFVKDNGLWIFGGNEKKDFFKNFDTIEDLGKLKFKFGQGYFCNEPKLDMVLWNDFEKWDSAKKNCVQIIINALDRSAPINICPLYGIGLNDDGYIATLPVKLSQKMIIFNLVTGILYAQDYGIDALKRGAIVLVMAKVGTKHYKATEVYKALMSLVNGEGVQDTPLGNFVNQHTKGRVDYIEYNSPLLEAKLKELESNPRSVLIINIGAIPQAFFNYLYRHASLPPFMEGAATVNFVTNFGISFFRLTGNYPELPLTGLRTVQDPNARASVKTCTLFLDLETDWDRKLKQGGDTSESLPFAGLGKFIIDSKNDKDKLYEYFSELATFFHDPKNDKLLMALNYTFLTYLKKK